MNQEDIDKRLHVNLANHCKNEGITYKWLNNGQVQNDDPKYSQRFIELVNEEQENTLKELFLEENCGASQEEAQMFVDIALGKINPNEPQVH